MEVLFLFYYFRRKCEVVRDVDGMEPKDLTSSRSLYTSTQIKIRYAPIKKIYYFHNKYVFENRSSTITQVFKINSNTMTRFLVEFTFPVY
jgi:hypothetical protein